MKEIKLKPCPFCGEIPKIHHYETYCDDEYFIEHECKNNAEITISTYSSGYPELIAEIWNQRFEK